MAQRQGIVSAEPYWRPMSFEIAGEITQIETIAAGAGIRELPRPRRPFWWGSVAEGEGDRPGPPAERDDPPGETALV